MKTACCFSFSPDERDVPTGEHYVRKLISLFPAYPNAYSLLAQNLNRQKKYSEIYELINKMLMCPISEEEGTYVVDGINCAKAVLLQNNEIPKLKELIEKGKLKYPKLALKLDEIGSANSLEIVKLWAEGQKFIHSPVKDFKYGKKFIFTNYFY